MGEKDLASDLGRKADEHDKELRKRRDSEAEMKMREQRSPEEIEEEEKEDWTGKKADVDVGEALGGRKTKVVLAAEE
jgi:hypothetical protein